MSDLEPKIEAAALPNDVPDLRLNGSARQESSLKAETSPSLARPSTERCLSRLTIVVADSPNHFPWSCGSLRTDPTRTPSAALRMSISRANSSKKCFSSLVAQSATSSVATSPAT